MQEENTGTANYNKIESTTAVFRNFSPEKPIGNAIIYFWESHTNNPDDKEKHQATIELIYKVFDMYTCEKYEVRTGYLSRYNYLAKPINESSVEEIEEAIIKGKQEQNEWINRCKLDLHGFKIKNWQECIFKDENIYFEQCKNIVLKKLEDNPTFKEAFEKSVDDFAEKHDKNRTNGWLYVLEETTWVLSLMLVHINKPVYLIHVDKYNLAIRELVDSLDGLKKAVKLLYPKIRKSEFMNIAHFLMNYRENKHVGYSYAIKNKNIVNAITTFKNDLNSHSLSQKYENASNELLRYVVEKLPGHVYWMDRDNVYLGCNESQAKDMGLESWKDVIGKNNSDFHSIEDAIELDRINKTVMETCEDFEGEEPCSSIYKHGNYLSHKSPLFDIHGKVIGLLGISIDITDRKRVEQLEIENKLQQIKIDSQEEFQEFVKKMSHDIGMPLKELEAFKDECSYLKTEDYEKLRKINTKIQEIAGDILCRKEKDRRVNFDSKERDILIPLALEEVLLKQNRQHKESNIEFKYSFNPLNTKDQFVFIRGNHTYFERMMSNLTNNAAEAFEGKSGVVEITLNADDKIVKIGINDNGKGMPQETVGKILNNVSVGTTKSTGHGIGLEQVKDALKLFNGKMEIESKEGKGTKITLTFPRSELPSWIAERVTLRKGSTVVILDDDESMHDLWENLLKDYSNDLTLKFFTKGDDARKFIRFSFEKDNMFLISDYDLREENTGLMVIKETEMQTQSIVVTSIHDDWKVLDALERTKMQMIPKQFLFSNNVEVFVE